MCTGTLVHHEHTVSNAGEGSGVKALLEGPAPGHRLLRLPHQPRVAPSTSSGAACAPRCGPWGAVRALYLQRQGLSYTVVRPGGPAEDEPRVRPGII